VVALVGTALVLLGAYLTSRREPVVAAQIVQSPPRRQEEDVERPGG
jgi:hypothetical protein